MPTLYVLSGPQIGKTFELRDGAVLGRAPSCDAELAVALRASSVSRDHARIERDADSWFVVDLGSSNGTHVEGVRVKRHELVDKSEFRLGELELRIRVEASRPQAPLIPKNPEPDSFDEMEIELEEEIELEAPTPEPPKPRATAPPPIPPSSPPPKRDLAQTQLTRPASSEEPVLKRKVLQYSRVENRSGFFTTEISQWPFWVQVLMVLVGLALFAGLAYAAYFGVTSMRG